MPRPLSVKVIPESIAHNIRVLKGLCPAAQLLAVVKANAYGHGLNNIFLGLQEADGLALLEIEGAQTLRQKGWAKPILLLEGAFSQDELFQAARLRCDLVLHEPNQLEQIVQQAKLINDLYSPRLFIKLNTGMNRLGFTSKDLPAVVTQVNQLVKTLGWPTPVLMTHFANADTGDAENCTLSVNEQYQQLSAVQPANWLTSLANSAGVLNHSDQAGDFIRPGIAIYGASPGPRGADAYGLKPALCFESEIISIQEVAKGAAVGYGSRWTASRPSRIGVVACGYADGYPRHAKDGAPVAVEGIRTKLVGRVSMDMLTVDITDIPHAAVGSAVQLWGDLVSVDEVAKASDTIGYELLCATHSRRVDLAI